MSYADDMNATPLNKLPPPLVQSKQDAGAAAPPNYKDLLNNMDVNAGNAGPSRAQQQMMMMQQQDDGDDEQYYPQQQQQYPPQMYGPPPPGMYPGYNTYNSYEPPPQRHEPSHRSSKKTKSALKDKKSGGGGGGGVMGFLKANKNVLIVAIVAFLAMRFVAPRLRAFPMMLSPMGGLSAPGMAIVALLIGASTKVADMF